MTTHPQSLPTLDRPPRPTTRRVGAVAACLGLVLFIVVGLIVWQATRSGAATVPTAVEITTPAAPAGAPRNQAAPTLYLVGSQAEAQVVYTVLEEINAVLVTSGEPTRAQQVLWFDSAEAEASFWSARIEQEGAALGLAPVTVVDLRAPAARVLEQDPAVSDQEMYQRAQSAPTSQRTDRSDTRDDALVTLPTPGTNPTSDLTHPADTAAHVTTVGGMVELYAEQAAAARATTNAKPDLDEDQATAVLRSVYSGACGTTIEPTFCY